VSGVRIPSDISPVGVPYLNFLRRGILILSDLDPTDPAAETVKKHVGDEMVSLVLVLDVLEAGRYRVRRRAVSCASRLRVDIRTGPDLDPLLQVDRWFDPVDGKDGALLFFEGVDVFLPPLPLAAVVETEALLRRLPPIAEAFT